MQHIVQEVVETLKTFVGHGEQSVMLIEAATDEAPLLLKCFDIVERDELSNDIFLMHGDEFQDTRLFVETIIERQREQIEGVNEELEKRGDEKIAEIPPVLFERNAPSVERFSALFQHIRHIVQPERASHLGFLSACRHRTAGFLHESFFTCRAENYFRRIGQYETHHPRHAFK